MLNSVQVQVLPLTNGASDRVVEGVRLESACGVLRHQGFESLLALRSLRTMVSSTNCYFVYPSSSLGEVVPSQ